MPRATGSVIGRCSWLAVAFLAACGDGGLTIIGRDRMLSCAPAASSDPCTQLPMLPTDPIIDGTLECGVALTPSARDTWTGSQPMPASIAAEVGIAWRPGGIYFFVRVTKSDRDPPVGAQPEFCGDAIHLFVDDDAVYPAAPDYGPVGTRQYIAVAPSDAMTSVARGRMDVYPNVIGPWDPARFRAFPTAEGWVLEAFVTAEELGVPVWQLLAPGRVGVGAAIAIGDGVHTETSEICPVSGAFWMKNSPTPHPRFMCPSAHCNTGAFCNADLMPAR